MDILALVGASFLLAPLAAWLGGRGSPFVAAVPALLFAGFARFLPSIGAGGSVVEVHPWVPSLGITAAFKVDGLSLLLALLITGIGTLVFLYASHYLKGRERLPRFYATLTLFMGAMIGAVLADDLVLLIVFWELTSLTSFLLIGTTPEDAESRRGAQQGLLVTVAGGLALLAATILLGAIAGTYSISGMLDQRAAIAAHPAAPAIIVLLALGAFAKSAQAPFHSWLANAMVAPTPVSAFLHSATMVKLGVYLLARFNPLFEGDALWIALLTGVGGVTMVAGSVLALRETDLKRVLAYSTVVSLGTLVMLIGLPGAVSATAVAAFLLGHALYKACLFLVAGIVDHETGTRDSSRLGGLRHVMPVTAAAAALGALSMAGLPPFLGFAGKELVYETGLGAAWWWIVIGIALAANGAMVVVAAIVAVRCFMGPRVATPVAPHDPGFAMLAGPLLLALLGLVFGVAPWLVGDALVGPAAAAIFGRPVDSGLSLWHGFTPMLALSVLTLAIGVGAYLRWEALRTALAGIGRIDAWGPDRAYDALLRGLQRVAVWQTDVIQSGSLRVYVGQIFIAVAIGGLSGLFLLGGFSAPSVVAFHVADAALVLLLIAATLALLTARGFVSGIVAAGVVGLAVALVFLLNGAPDLAFTQFSVEALAIVILLAIIGRLPFRSWDRRAPSERVRDGAIAAALGLSATLVMLSVLALPFDARLSDFFRAASVPEAHGRNLVNVIIVDFRALDTLGEIAVLGLAAVAASAVIAGVRRRLSERPS